MRITQVNNQYVIEFGDNKLHILNRKSLVWNLKRWGGTPKKIKYVMDVLDQDGVITLPTLTKEAV